MEKCIKYCRASVIKCKHQDQDNDCEGDPEKCNIGSGTGDLEYPQKRRFVLSIYLDNKKDEDGRWISRDERLRMLHQLIAFAEKEIDCEPDFVVIDGEDYETSENHIDIPQTVTKARDKVI